MRPWRSITTQIARPILSKRINPNRTNVRYNHNQTVYVREPYISRNKLLLIFLNGAMAYGVSRLFFRKLDSAIPDEEVEELLAEAEEGDEESLFVPLSWPKRMPQQYYHQSDEEWQEFIKFSNDKERKKAIRGRSLYQYHNVDSVLIDWIRGARKSCCQRHISQRKNAADIWQEHKIEKTLARSQVSRRASTRICTTGFGVG